MRLQFYHQDELPPFFDVLINKDGSLCILNPAALKFELLIIVIEECGPYPTIHQISSIYTILTQKKECEVEFFGLSRWISLNCLPCG